MGSSAGELNVNLRSDASVEQEAVHFYKEPCPVPQPLVRGDWCQVP